MPVDGNKDLLLELQGALLCSGNAEQNQSGHALLGTAYDLLSPDPGTASSHQHEARGKADEKTKMKPFTYVGGYFCYSFEMYIKITSH